MNNPNSCCNDWDQRIPNESLYDRVFLVQNPPVINQEYPMSTNRCVQAMSNHKSVLLIDKKLEQQSADYWCGNLNTEEEQGIPTVDHPFNRCNQPLSELQQKNPQSPWVYGVNYNIGSESQLRRLNYYNPKDCIVNPCKLQELNRKADSELLKSMQHDQHYPNNTPLMFNNNTRVINMEPVNFEYKRFLDSCCQERTSPQGLYGDSMEFSVI